MSTISKAQKTLLSYLVNGCELFLDENRKPHIVEKGGFCIKIGVNTFNSLFMGRYLDPNGRIFGKDYYKITDKGREAIK